MRTRFRGITVREGVLVRGDGGLGGVEPVPGVRRRGVAEPWLRCAEEAAAGDWPAPVRDSVPVNVTVPAVGPEQAHAIVARRRLPHRQGQGGRARPGAGRRRGPARGRARRARPDRPDPGRRQRRLGVDEAVAAIGVLDRAAGGLEYVEQPVRRASRTSPPYAGPRRGADRGRRVDPSGRRPLPGARPGGGRHRRAQGAAARRRAGVPADRRGHRPAGRGLLGAGDLASASPPASRWPPRCPSCPTPAGWPPCSCSPTTSSPSRCCRSTVSCRSGARRRRAALDRWPRPRPGRRTGGRGWPRCALRQDRPS